VLEASGEPEEVADLLKVKNFEVGGLKGEMSSELVGIVKGKGGSLMSFFVCVIEQCLS